MDGKSGGVILRLGARVANMFSPMMNSMNIVNSALPLQPLDLKIAVGNLITASSDLIGSCDIFFSQLEKTCRTPGAKANLPSTCETYLDFRPQIPIAVKNLTDLILRVVYYAQNYWHSEARESRRQLRLASQNFEDVLAQLAHVVLENANSPTKDDASLIPDTLYWIRDTNTPFKLESSNVSTISPNSDLSDSPPIKSQLVRNESEHSTLKREPRRFEKLTVDGEFIREWSRRIQLLAFNDNPSSGPILNIAAPVNISNLSATELRSYVRNLSRQLGVRLHEAFLAISEHPYFTSQVNVDADRIEGAEKRLINYLEELIIMTNRLQKEVHSIFSVRSVINSGEVVGKHEYTERIMENMAQMSVKLFEMSHYAKTAETPSLALQKMFEPLNTLLDYAISITKYVDGFLISKEDVQKYEDDLITQKLSGKIVHRSNSNGIEFIDVEARKRIQRHLSSPSEYSQNSGNLIRQASSGSRYEDEVGSRYPTKKKSTEVGHLQIILKKVKETLQAQRCLINRLLARVIIPQTMKISHILSSFWRMTDKVSSLNSNLMPCSQQIRIYTPRTQLVTLGYQA
ncbi:hypothetical protein HK096_008391 [Nowakowskiella sp. JEL0078]|nr:hypothetical protein HK096_008391 [Nowakowskiella sp. JEL0078]